MSETSVHLLAAPLKRRAKSIAENVPRLELACLKVSERLGEAIPRLGDLAALFEALSHSLEGEEIGAAAADLSGIADELAGAANELSEESRALAAVMDLNQPIGSQTSTLLICMRTIASLVFSMKIEAAPLSNGADDLAAFAEDVRKLSDSAHRSLEDYQATHGRLEALLHSSCEAQTQFQRRHQASLKAIASEIAQSLGALEELRRRTLVALREIGALSRNVSTQIGQCIVALQVGDSTRQRVEHVHAALGLAVDLLEGNNAGAAAEFAAEVGSDRERAVARLCRLQALQLEAALDEFGRDMATISGSLGELGDDSGDLARRGRALFGASDLKDGSYLATLERKLNAARPIVAECRRARADVDQAAAAVGTTMADLQGRTSGLSEIVGDVTIIGTNALLKSTRLGERGKGFTVIAQELRGYATLVVNGIKELPPMLSQVAACAGRVGEAGRTLDSGRLAALDVRMSAAIRAFGANADEMTAALKRLELEADSVGATLRQAVETLAADGEIEAVLRAAAAELDTITTHLGGAERRWPRVDRLLDRLLRPVYSMASERNVHDAFTGHVADDAEAAPEDDSVEACLL